jgi:two-component SAPR family response regulator
MRGSASARTLSRAAALPASEPRLSVSLVGRFGLRLDGQPVHLRTRKAAAVLGYLALSETKQESRERLVGLLWSRSDEERARASLRQVVRELRSVLGDAGFTIHRGLTSGCSKEWTISTRRFGFGCWPSARPSMKG